MQNYKLINMIIMGVKVRKNQVKSMFLMGDVELEIGCGRWSDLEHLFE